MFYNSSPGYDIGGFNMKKICILFLFLFSLSNYCFSDDLEITYPMYPNKEALNCADRSRRIANSHLLNAQLLIDDVGDLSEFASMDRLRNVIGIAICSISIPEPRAKILAIALSVLADIT
ncbi:MAG: hypothetical protein AABY22_01835, partial [Nanoarchaeota archaeon]